VAFRAVQPFADTAFVASKNVGMDFPKRSHLLYSASFALVARAILDCGTCQIGKKKRGRRAEDRGQRTEGRGQRTEDRGQRTEDRGQRTEGILKAETLNGVSGTSDIEHVAIGNRAGRRQRS
jgi:hypothetical protein